MRSFRVVAGGVTVASAMLWAVLANAQVSGTDNESEAGEPDTPAAADADASNEIPEELFESRVMDEIEGRCRPRGQNRI